MIVATHASFHDFDWKKDAYLAKHLPRRLFGNSFYAYYAGYSSTQIAENHSATPCVGLEIENNELRGVYYVTRYRTSAVHKRKSHIYLAEIVDYKIIDEGDYLPIELAKCDISYGVGRIHVKSDIDMNSYNYLLLPGTQYSLYTDIDSCTVVDIPFYYIVDLNLYGSL